MMTRIARHSIRSLPRVLRDVARILAWAISIPVGCLIVLFLPFVLLTVIIDAATGKLIYCIEQGAVEVVSPNGKYVARSEPPPCIDPLATFGWSVKLRSADKVRTRTWHTVYQCSLVYDHPRLSWLAENVLLIEDRSCGSVNRKKDTWEDVLIFYHPRGDHEELLRAIFAGMSEYTALATSADARVTITINSEEAASFGKYWVGFDHVVSTNPNDGSEALVSSARRRIYEPPRSRARSIATGTSSAGVQATYHWYSRRDGVWLTVYVDVYPN